MAAPVRYLSGRQQQQKIGIEGSTQNEKVLEVVGRAGIGTTAFEPGVGLEVRGDQIVTGILTVGSVEVSTTSIFTGNIDANGNLDVDGHTELDDVNVSGASTFTGAADFNGDIDVDGHTELDDVNVSGASTFTGAADFNGNLDVDGHTELDDVNVSGASTFTGAADFNGDIDVDGQTELDNLNVSGVSTFVGVATFSTNDVYVAQRLFVGGVEVGGATNTFAGINTFTDTTDNTLGNSNTGAVQIDGGLGVDKNVTIGAGLSVAGNAGIGSLNVVGVSTFGGLVTVTTGDVYIAQRLFVGGLEVEGSGSENTFTGINTFTNQTDNVLGDTNTGSLQGNGGLGIDKNASFGSTVFVQNAIGINSTAPIGQFDVNGHTELDDVNVSGAITATTFTGNLAGTATIAEYTSEWNITSNGSSDYRFTGPGFDGTENDPTIYLTRGEEYKFTNNMGAHPFQIRTAINGSAYNDGITNNGVSNGTLTWDVQMDAPNVLYYQCTAHAGMVGKIYIGNSGSSIDIDGHIETDTLNVSGVSTFTGAADFNGNVDIDGYTELDDLNVSGVGTIGGITLKSAGSNNAQIDLVGTDTLFIKAGNVGDGKVRIQGHSGYDNIVANAVNGPGTTELHFAAGGGTGGKKLETLGAGVSVYGTTETQQLTVSGVSTFTGAIDANGNLDVDGHTELDDVNVSGVSTFTGAIDANGGMDVSGGETTLSSATVSDLTSGRVVLAGTSGELEDNSKLTFNGTTLTVAGDASFNGNVTIGGTLTSEDKTNVDSIGLVTARSGVRISAGGLVVTSGVSTFVDNLVGTISTATNLAGGDTGDIPYQSANGTTTFVDATGVGAGLVLMWGGSNPIWSPVSGASGNFGGITLLEEGSIVGSAGSVTGLNFVGNNVTATAPSGIANGVVTLSDTPTFDSLKVTGISTIPNVSGVTTFSDIVNIGTGITFYASSGIISATQFFGSGENLTDLINQRIEGIRILDEGVQVGSGTTFTNLNFVGNGVVATGIGTTGIITITDTKFEPDAQENLVAGTNAGANLDGTGCCNIFFGKSAGNGATSADGNIVMGCCAASGVLTGGCNISLGVVAGKCLTSGYQNVFIGRQAGQYSTTCHDNVFIGDNTAKRNDGNYNIALGNSALAGSNTVADNTGDHNIAMGHYAGLCISSGENNVFLGEKAGRYITTGQDNVTIGRGAGMKMTSGPDNVFIGQYTGGAGGSAVSGGCNIAIGRAAGNQLTGGCYNIYFGEEAGYCNQIGLNQIFIGCGAGGRNRGDLNIFLGRGAGRGSSTPGNNTGDNNIGVGCDAGRELTTGCDNIFLGQYAGRGNTTGCYNIFFGKCTAAGGTVTGERNIATGRCAGYNLTSGCDNVFLGYDAGYTSADASRNVFIGQQAGCCNTSGDNNIAIGYQVSLPSATGSCQLAIGNGSDRWLTGDSSFNVTVSTASTFSNDGLNVTGVITATSFEGDGSNLTGIAADKIFEGNTEVETVDTGSNGHIKFTTEGSERARIDASGRMGIGVTNPVAKLEVNVGSAVTAFDIQGSAGQLFSVTNNLTSGSIFSVNDVSGIPSIDVDADGTIQLAPFSTTEFVGVGTTNPTTKLHVIGEVTATDFNSTSDARLKTNVQVIDDPLAKVLQINGVSFNWVENNKPSMGVIADNIEEVLPELVSDTDPKTVNYNGLIGLLIEVVKDQQTQINSLNERLSQLE